MSSRRYFARSPGPADRSRTRTHNFTSHSQSRSSSTRYQNRYRTTLAPSNSAAPTNNRIWNGPSEGSNVERKESSNVLPLNEPSAREKLLVPEVLDHQETEVVQKTIDAFKSRGHFDEFRKDFFNGIEKMPSYRSLRYKVMSTVSKYTSRQGPFHMGLKKNKMRDGLRDELMRDSNGLSTWINELVDDLIGPNIERKIRSVVQETLEDFIPDETPLESGLLVGSEVNSGSISSGAAQRPERLPTPPPLVKHYSEQLAIAKIESERQEQLASRMNNDLAGIAAKTKTVGGVRPDDAAVGSPGSPVPPGLVAEGMPDTSTNGLDQSTVIPQLLFNQLAHFSMYPQDAPPELREALMSHAEQQQRSTGGVSSANQEVSVMVDEPPTGVEDIISPEMMDIEDGDSPDPIANTENWSAEESSATAEYNEMDSTVPGVSINEDNNETPVRSSQVTSLGNALVTNGAAQSPALNATPHSRTTLGSLLREKKKQKTSVVRPTPLRKESNSDIESISSKSDFDSSSSSSSESSSDDDTDKTITVPLSPASSKSHTFTPSRRTTSRSNDPANSPVASKISSAINRDTSPTEHVTRYGRKGRQPNRYSPDADDRRASPANGKSPGKSKSHKSTPKRFYPGNSPSMLQKRRKSPMSPVPKKRERVQIDTEMHSKRSDREISIPNEVLSKHESSTSSKSSNSRHSGKEETREKRSKHSMPKVHLSSRSHKESTSSDRTKSDLETKDLNLRDDRKYSRDSDWPQDDRRASLKREDSIEMNPFLKSEESVRERTPAALKTEDPLQKVVTESEREPEAEKNLTFIEEKVTLLDVDEFLSASGPVISETQNNMKKEKYARNEDEIEEGEITDDSDSNLKPPSPVHSPQIPQKPAKISPPPFKAVRKPHLERGGPQMEVPPPPPLKKMGKKKSKRRQSVSSSSEDSDDSLFERLNKKERRQRLQSRLGYGNVNSNASFVIDDAGVEPPSRGLLEDERTSRRGHVVMSKVVLEKEPIKAPVQGQISRSKDSWSRRRRIGRQVDQVRRRERSNRRRSKSRSRSGSGNRRSRSPRRNNRRQGHSKSRNKSVSPHRKNSSHVKKLSERYKSKRALSPEFDHKRKETSPLGDLDKVMPKIRLSRDRNKPKSPISRSKSSKQELPPPPPLTKRIPNPPPPMASFPDETSSENDGTNDSSSSDASSGSESSSSETELKLRKLQRSRSAASGYHSKESRHVRQELMPDLNVSISRRVPSGSKRSTEECDWSRKITSSTRRPAKYSDDQGSSKASSDEVLISNSHTPPYR